MTIWKFPLKFVPVQKVPMPKGAELLHVGIQEGRVTIWARVDPDAETEDRLIAVVGTGHAAPDSPHVGTVNDGPFVWHIFDGGT